MQVLDNICASQINSIINSHLTLQFIDCTRLGVSSLIKIQIIDVRSLEL